MHRLDFDEAVEDDTAGRFHVLNLVAGERGRDRDRRRRVHPLAYAETIVVPASVGAYRLRRLSGPPARS